MPLAAPGDLVQILDHEGRYFLLRLASGGRLETHRGVLAHDSLIGQPFGSKVHTHLGKPFYLFTPSIHDLVVEAKRQSQILFPKDIGIILMQLNVGPGMTVLEAGTGSGALTLALLRFVGPTGRVISVERRDDHAAHARKTITRWLGAIPEHLDLRIGEVEDVIAEVRPERLVLDLPEPWHAVAVAAEHQPGGGILCAYLPTVPQLQTLTDAMRETGRYDQIEISETLFRTWTVEGRSVRPDHRMVGHTGFLVVARKVNPSFAPEPVQP